MNIKVIGITLGGLLLVAAASGVKYQKNTSDRSLASITAVVGSLPFSKSQSQSQSNLKALKIKEQFLISCESLNDEIKSTVASSQVVMLKFKNCDYFLNKKAESFKVKNITNGYDGQIFIQKHINKKNRAPAQVYDQANQHFSTDYIQLQTGENIIELQISLNDGQKLNKKIKINRL